MRPDEKTIWLQSAEIERQIRHAGGQYPTGCAAGQIGLEGMSVRHAAAGFLDQLACADAGRRQPHARILYPARHREAAQPLCVAPAVLGEPAGAPFYDMPAA